MKSHAQKKNHMQTIGISLWCAWRLHSTFASNGFIHFPENNNNTLDHKIIARNVFFESMLLESLVCCVLYAMYKHFVLNFSSNVNFWNNHISTDGKFNVGRGIEPLNGFRKKVQKSPKIFIKLGGKNDNNNDESSVCDYFVRRTYQNIPMNSRWSSFHRCIHVKFILFKVYNISSI